MIDVDAVREALRELVKVRAGDLELTIEEVRLLDEQLCIVLRFIVYDDGQVRDIKEQELRAPAPLFDDVQRVAAFAEGHAEALRMVFESPARDIASAMPHELLHLRVLELHRPKQSHEFMRALLVNKRLGKLRA